jgi:hypothetical protein
MRRRRKKCVLLTFLLIFGTASTDVGAAAVPALEKSKQEAEAKGYIFINSHDQIVAAARKEGKMRALSGLDPETIKAMVSAFRKKYPSRRLPEVCAAAASRCGKRLGCDVYSD